MDRHCALTDKEGLGDLTVGPAKSHQGCDFTLAFGEAVVLLSRGCPRLCFRPRPWQKGEGAAEECTSKLGVLDAGCELFDLLARLTKGVGCLGAKALRQEAGVTRDPAKAGAP